MYKCLFQHGNTTLKSNGTKFKEIAIREHVLDHAVMYNKTTPEIIETQFASSKKLCIVFFIL